jgi:hypothetical protein
MPLSPYRPLDRGDRASPQPFKPTQNLKKRTQMTFGTSLLARTQALSTVGGLSAV